MIQLYKNIQSGMNRCQALRQAALRQKDIVEKRYKHSNPLYWGAFLFLGEP
jgi:CHAT domain-containing protein